MLASLIVWGALVQAQNQLFPKPNVESPAVLKDSTIFKYLDEGDKTLDWRPFRSGRDWSNLVIPPTKPDALKLKVLLAVAERDFSDPHYSNTLENRDKSRLLEAANRLKSLYSAISGGSVSIEIVPRFYTHPFFDIRDFKSLIDTEFNKTKFEADDSNERGPFAAILAISSSHVTLPKDPNSNYSIIGFADLGGPSQDMWLEEELFYLTQNSIQSRLGSHFGAFQQLPGKVHPATSLTDPLYSLEPDFVKLFDPNFRQDGQLINKWAESGMVVDKTVSVPQSPLAVEPPGSIEGKDEVLTYSELSLMRAGAFALPASAKFMSAKSLKFELKTTSRNPLAAKIWYGDGSKPSIKEEILGTYPGMIPVNPDGNWQSISVNLAGLPGPVIGVSFGEPASFYGTTRIRAELNQYQFRNFELSQETGMQTSAPGSFFTGANWETEDSLRQVLSTGTKFAKRTALESTDKLKAYKGLAPLLLSLTGDLDAGIAHDATKAYFELVLSGQPSATELASLGNFLKAPPNEYAREVALSYVSRNQDFASAADVAANSVRENIHVRIQAIDALGALSRSNNKAKEFCRNLLLTATSQDMGIIRKTAALQLDPTIQENLDRLVYLMVNDPCESVRLACLKVVSAAPNAPKDKVLGTLADDSPSLRELVPSSLGPNSPFLREALQKMVVDQDPYVRVSALHGFAMMTNVQAGEIQNVFTDKHPAVQIALLEGAKKGAWKISADALDKLKASSIKAIATLASEVK